MPERLTMRLPVPNATLRRTSAGSGSPAAAGEVLARVRYCRSAWERLRGVIGYGPLPPGLGVALPRCGAIHTAFVRGRIDVLFLREGNVVGIRTGLSPWRLAGCPGAQTTVELAAGSVDRMGLKVGDRVELRFD